jgi:two-component system response regulator AtoC
MSAKHVLVVDDEANMRRVLEIMLARMGYKTWSAANGVEAFELQQQVSFDLVISDLRMPEMDGVALLKKLRETGSEIPVIIITAQGTIESAVESMRLGACDYLLRPFDVDTLELAIRRVFTQSDLLRRNVFLNEQLAPSVAGLIGESAPIRAVVEQIAQVAPTTATVLITGETGTGKEIVARAIHQASARKDGLFVPINCAAIPAEMLESELFGHEKGAFTGALRERIGKFELADGGTIFLDEITEMPVALQSKLLRVLQGGVVERLGSNRSLELDLRVIAATNRRPLDAVREQRLREDLYYRLNVFSMELPPLRARLDDIEILLRHFIAKHASGKAPAFNPQVLPHLRAYSWPGNVRELENLVERALVLSHNGRLETVHFPLTQNAGTTASAPEIGGEIADFDLDRAVGAVESRYVREALLRSDGNKARAAALLKVSERTVWNKIKKYDLD